MHEPQQDPQPGREIAEPCTECGVSAVADPVDGGLHCATCGQWEYLCDGCTPNVPENSREAAWRCPECRGPTLH